MNGPGSKEPRTTRKNVPGRQNGPAGSSVSTAAAYANAYQNNTNNEPPKMDWDDVTDSILRKYVRTHKLKHRGNKREDIVAAVSKHFNAVEVNEKDVMAYFVYTGRNQGNVLRLPPRT